MMDIAYADYQRDHKDVQKLARQSPYTKGFCDVRYIQEYYSKGWVLRAEEDCQLQGFLLLRHCSNKPWTTIYYLSVCEEGRGKGIGRALVQRAARDSPHQELRLGVDEANHQGRRFWKGLDFAMLVDETGEPVYTHNKDGSAIVQMTGRKEDVMNAMKPEKRLDIHEFGARLLHSKDLDPVYVMVYEAMREGILIEEHLFRWLLAYWCFYHVGEDIEACRAGLMKFTKCHTAQALLAGGRKGGLWK